ncbi:MAG: hypothetical protein K2W96_22475 [Gemmataceae bacterium]|nr:hypothetical protein [Gemmataceae bacterium]
MKTDHPWKEALELHLREALQFMCPDIASRIDWSAFPRSLEQEVRKALPDSAMGDRIVDRLFGCTTLEKEELYVHLEVQGTKQEHFPLRVVDYNSGARLHLGHRVVSVAVLVDSDPGWKPDTAVYEELGYREEVRYPVFKATDWRDRLDELEGDPNPFKLFVAAHLRAQATERDLGERERQKLRLLLNAAGRARDDVRSWQRLLDWLMPLPPEAERRVMDELDRTLGGTTMPFMSMWERRAMEQGEAKGEAKGLQRGALLTLKTKFGDAGLALAPRLEKAEPAAVEAVFAALERDAPLDEVAKLLP